MERSTCATVSPDGPTAETSTSNVVPIGPVIVGWVGGHGWRAECHAPCPRSGAAERAMSMVPGVRRLQVAASIVSGDGLANSDDGENDGP